jgi:hypothetical protein
MLTLLLWLSPVILIGVVVWNYRRQAAAREAASNERLKALLGKAAGQDAAQGVAPAATAANPVPVSTAGAPMQAVPAFTARERLLPPPQTLLYYLLKSSVPDHEVLAMISVASIIDLPAGVSGLEREARQRRLAAVTVDFVVCDKSFRAIAVVHSGVHPGQTAEALAYTRTSCESAGLRWVEVAPDVPPTRDALRALVIGA